jgi:hypothetical protein
MWSGGDHEPAADLVPVPRGRAFRGVTPVSHPPITRGLADELVSVLERFAGDAGFDERRPVEVTLLPGTLGQHRVGRAADLYAVGGRGLDAWKRDWDRDPDRAGQRRRNLGWRLYRALQRYGRWARPSGYPIQLFGPWTREEGPWSGIGDRLLHAHRDHIHVAK